jgi:protein TonB
MMSSQNTTTSSIRCRNNKAAKNKNGDCDTGAKATSSGFPRLDEAALQAARSWEFEPARVGSLAVKSDIEVPVRFKLTD